MAEGLTVFISHAHEDHQLARAWQKLIKASTLDQVRPWYSSDELPSGGIEYGEEWRKTVTDRVSQSNTILLIVTPGSMERPWLVWEAGIAQGNDNRTIPVKYFMGDGVIHSVFQNQQVLDGESEDAVFLLCARLLRRHFGSEISEDSKSYLKANVARYMGEVKEAKRRTLERMLFHRHFHNKGMADSMRGTWFAKWTQQLDDGAEVVFETDSLNVWTTEERLRIVGTSTKEGRDALSVEAREAAKNYPMEGVVSSDGWVALSYWSAATIPICGTTLLQPKGATGELFEGTWEGFTARSFIDQRVYTRGRVVMSRSQRLVESYWPELRKPGIAPNESHAEDGPSGSDANRDHSSG